MRTALAVLVVASALACLVLEPVGVAAVNFPQPTVVSSDPVDNTPHVLDGRVYGIAEVGSKVIVGGTFTRVRNHNSSTEHVRSRVFAYDKQSGLIDASFRPSVDNHVNDVEAGLGNTVYLGGAFLTVNGLPSRGLAKLNVTDGSTVPGFGAATTASVEDIVLRGATLYVGGVFGKVRNVERSRLGAVDAVTGQVNLELNLPITEPIAGTASVKQLDVTPDGSRLVVVGTSRGWAGSPATRSP